MILGGAQRDDEDRPKNAALSLRPQKVIALGLCASCYSLKRKDEEYFGSLREGRVERRFSPAS
jgi:hypothetical protein